MMACPVLLVWSLITWVRWYFMRFLCCNGTIFPFVVKTYFCGEILWNYLSSSALYSQVLARTDDSPELIIICWLPVVFLTSIIPSLFFMAFFCKKSFTFSLLTYFSFHLWFYQYGLRYFYSVQWAVIHYCLYYHAHIDPIAFILKTTSLRYWAGMGWSHVHLVPHCLRKKSSNTLFSFPWDSHQSASCGWDDFIQFKLIFPWAAEWREHQSFRQRLFWARGKPR